MPVDIVCVCSLLICSNGGTRYHTCEIEDSRCGGEVIRLVAPSGTIAKQQGAEQEADAFEIAIVNSGCGGARLGTSQTPRALGGSGFVGGLEE